MNKDEQDKYKTLEDEIKFLAKIENEYKALGRMLYNYWLDGTETHNFNSIMEKFHKRLNKLKELKK